MTPGGTPNGAPRGIRTPNRQIRRLVLRVDLVGSRRIWAPHVGRVVDPDGSRRVPSDRLMINQMIKHLDRPTLDGEKSPPGSGPPLVTFRPAKRADPGLVGVVTAYTLFLLVPALAGRPGQQRRGSAPTTGRIGQAMRTRHRDPAMAPRIPRRLRVARLVGELLSPPPILVVLALVVAWASSPTPATAVLWGIIAAVFASVLPYALILRGVRQGRLSDKNISLREQRIRFGLVAITSILLGLVLLAAFDAPAEMVALVASIAVGVACGWVITLWWKISVHAAIAAGAATVLLLVFGPALLGVWPLVAVIAWSRVQVGDHTAAQVVAGVALGVVVNATFFTLLR